MCYTGFPDTRVQDMDNLLKRIRSPAYILLAEKILPGQDQHSGSRTGREKK
ncbi:unnamed protein product, partial [Nesidiocoris tenuis]